MRFLLSTTGSRGEAQTVIAPAVRLKAMGNDVEVVAPPDFEELVTGNGIGFTPVGPTRCSARGRAPATSSRPAPG